MGWPDLEPWDRRARLARVHPDLTEDCLIAQGRSIPELRPEIDAQKSKEDCLRVVLRYFGDEGNLNPDPENPAIHGPGINDFIAAHNCPPWKELPPVESTAALAGERGTVAGGKNYAGEAVERVVRAAQQAQRDGRKLARTLRDEIAKQEAVTTYMVDMVFRLMKRDPPRLADAGRKGWLKVAGRVSATPDFIDLHELETRS